MFPSPAKAREVIVTPNIASFATPFSDGDAIGSLLSVSPASYADGYEARLTKVVVVDNAHQNAALELFFYDTQPSAVTDNAAFAPTDADNAKFTFQVTVPAGDGVFTANSVQMVNLNPSLKFITKNSRTLWLVIMADGTPTYGAATDLTIKLLFEF